MSERKIAPLEHNWNGIQLSNTSHACSMPGLHAATRTLHKLACGSGVEGVPQQRLHTAGCSDRRLGRGGGHRRQRTQRARFASWREGAARRRHLHASAGNGVQVQPLKVGHQVVLALAPAARWCRDGGEVPGRERGGWAGRRFFGRGVDASPGGRRWAQGPGAFTPRLLRRRLSAAPTELCTRLTTPGCSGAGRARRGMWWGCCRRPRG